MSWSFANANANGNATSAASAAKGPDLVEIQTEALGFLSIAGETKLRLLPQSWPADKLPPNTASLLSAAPTQGLIAAAGPDSLILATTESVRQAYRADVPAENDAKSFQPLTSIPIPRISQLAFSSDGSCLVIAAEEGGGLAVYDVQALRQGNQQSAFQLATNGIAVRALVPNPAPESSHFFAAVLAGGQLVLANLKDRQLVAGSNGQTFREGVSCVAWSAKGKQMVVGLEDGTAQQYDFQGNVKAQIPKPSPDLAMPMTSIYWLANDDFLTIHTPINADTNDSKYHIIHRDKASGNFVASEFTSDPIPAFGLRSPAHHFIARLKSFPPHLDDALILSSTAGIDVGVLTRATAPLAPDMPTDQIVNVYTTTSMANDARRAQMPMSKDGMGDTSPIGMVLDLSATETVKRPIPTEDMEESGTPLPALMLLNNEGILSTWWFVYSDSVRQKTVYPGLVTAGSQATPALQSAPFGAATTTPASAPATQSTPAFGSSTFVQSSQPATPAFGATTFGKPSTPSFGSTSTAGFGGTSTLGARSSPWGAPGAATSAFGKPAFGSSTPLSASAGNTAFGATSGLGANKSSPWGTPAASQQQTGGNAFGQPSQPGVSAFGQPSQAGSSAFGQPSQTAGSAFGQASQPASAAFGQPSVFGASTSGSENKSSQSPFASFGGGNKPAVSPFAKLGGNDTSKPSPFAAFGQKAESDSAKPSAFATFEQQTSTAPSFGSTTFPSTSAGSFGAPSAASAGSSSPWGATPQNQQSAVSTEATMEDEEETAPAPKPTFGLGSGQGAGKPAGFGGFTLGSTFQGDGSAKDDLPPPKNAGQSLFGSAFGSALSETAKGPVTPVKKEPGTDEPTLQDISTTPASPPSKPAEEESPGEPEAAPLPPDFTRSTPAKPAVDDAPLPPDFVISKATKAAEDDLPPIAGSPPVDLGQRSSPLSPAASSAQDEGPSEEDEDWEDESRDEEADEDEGDEEDDEDDEEHDADDDEDEAEDEEEEDDARTPAQKEQAAVSFGNRLSFPAQGSNTDEPAKSPATSTTPAGFPKAPLFAPPVKESPRSPSPVRSVSTARPPSRQGPAQTLPLPPHSRSHSRTSSRPSSTVPSSRAQPAQPAPPVPEAGELSDDEDQRVREILQSTVEPTRILEPFVAHHDYVGHVTKPGIGGQIENVYRDVNSMIDTLGLNARYLEAFVRGHDGAFKDGDRERSDLDDAEDWCLVEVEDLGTVEKNLTEDLEDGRVDGIHDKLSELGELQRDATLLRTKTIDMKKHISARADAAQRAIQRDAPLDSDAQMSQSELRLALSTLQRLLQDAEESLSILRADLATISSSSPTKQQRATPTVEAVTNTILKMTAMIEQKSGDVDMLEAQIRRLPRGIADLRLDEGIAEEESLLRTSVRGVSTPRRRVAPDGSALGMSGMLGSRFRTPNAVAQQSSPASSALGQSLNGSVRKKMADVTSADVARYQAKAEQRKKVLAALKDIVEKKGTRTVTAG